jgi:hypothetical protein
MDQEKVAIEVLKEIAINGSRLLVERQRAIDALTLFHGASMDALKEIVKKVDSTMLKERANLYIQRIKDGTVLSMNV